METTHTKTSRKPLHNMGFASGGETCEHQTDEY